MKNLLVKAQYHPCQMQIDLEGGRDAKVAPAST